MTQRVNKKIKKIHHRTSAHNTGELTRSYATAKARSALV